MRDRSKEVAGRLFGATTSRREGLIDRLPGTDLGSERRQRLQAAEIRFEAASKARDEIRREAARAEMDAIFDEYRAVQAAPDAAGAQEAPAESQMSFDGGVPRRFFKPAYRREDGPAALFRMAMQASSERGQRRAGLL